MKKKLLLLAMRSGLAGQAGPTTAYNVANAPEPDIKARMFEAAAGQEVSDFDIWSVGKEELVRLLRAYHMAQLPAWYCELNAWGAPEGFPIPLRAYDDHEQQYRDPNYRLAMEAVEEILGEEGCSKAWWLVQLKRSEEDWRNWYPNRPII